MRAILERRGILWVLEVVLAGMMTIMLLPMLFLYALDLAVGTIAPDAEWALGCAIGLLGIWFALLTPGSMYQRNAAIRWAVVAALALAVACLADLAWGTDFEFASVLTVASAGVALHQIVRLIRLFEKSPQSRADAV